MCSLNPTLSLSGVQFFCIYAILVLFWQMQRLWELFKSTSQDVIEADYFLKETFTLLPCYLAGIHGNSNYQWSQTRGETMK